MSGGAAEPLVALRVRIGRIEAMVDLGEVVEILRMVELGGVPSPRSRLRGAINLRGALIPVVDVAPLLGQPAVLDDPAHYVVIVASSHGSFGFLAEDTIDVAEIGSDGRRSLAGFASGTDPIREMVNLQGRVLPLLDVEALFADGH